MERLDPTTEAFIAAEAAEMRSTFSRLERAKSRRYRAQRLAESQGIPSLARAITEMSMGSLKANAPLEYEMFARGGDAQRIVVPFDALRDLSKSTAGAGGYLVATETQDPVDVLRPWSITARAGLTIDTGLVGDQAIPRTTGKAAPYWLSTETSELTPSTPSLGQIACTPKTAGAFCIFSRQLSKQISAEVFVSRELMRTVGTAVDQAVIAGTGNLGEPLGILSATGLQTQSGTSLNAGVRTMKQKVSTANGNDDAIAFITTPAIRELLEGRQLFTGVARTVWEDEKVADRPAYVTTDMPTDTMLCGDFSDVYFGLWGDGLVVEVNPYDTAGFKAGLIQARVLVSCDVAVRHPSSFVVASSIT